MRRLLFVPIKVGAGLLLVVAIAAMILAFLLGETAAATATLVPNADKANAGAWQNNDQINGGGDNDTIFGGPGNDQINGGGGTDTCQGQAGNDSLSNCEAGSAAHIVSRTL